MGKMGHREKIWAVALFVAIVVILSSMGGTILLQKDSSTGGMDVQWAQRTGGQTDSFFLNGSVIINNFETEEIRAIGDDGNVAWTYSCTSPTSIVPYNGHILLEDQYNGTKTLKCLDNTGALVWSHAYEDQRVLLGDIAVDGNFYSYPQGIGASGTTNTIMCIGIDCSVKWSFSTPDGMLSVRQICPDGTAILEHQGGSMAIESELISISSNGTVLGTMDWSRGMDDPGFKDLQRATNGTLLSIQYNDLNMTSNTVGLSEELRTLWSVQNGPYDGMVQGQGSLVYYLEATTVHLDNGQDQKVTTLCAYNTSNDSFVYRTNFAGSLSGKIWVDGGRVFLVCHGGVWAVDPEGRAHSANCSGWQVFGLYNGGLLLFSDHTMRMIGDDGSTAWQYDMDSGSITSIYPGASGTIIVVTNSAVTAIHRPTMSMNMIYLLGLIAFDLLVVLTAMIWLMRHRSNKSHTVH
jgi:hypothetical protein